MLCKPGCAGSAIMWFPSSLSWKLVAMCFKDWDSVAKQNHMEGEGPSLIKEAIADLGLLVTFKWMWFVKLTKREQPNKPARQSARCW